jgi:hypothetical protein
MDEAIVDDDYYDLVLADIRKKKVRIRKKMAAKKKKQKRMSAQKRKGTEGRSRETRPEMCQLSDIFCCRDFPSILR